MQTSKVRVVHHNPTSTSSVLMIEKVNSLMGFFCFSYQAIGPCVTASQIFFCFHSIFFVLFRVESYITVPREYWTVSDWGERDIRACNLYPVRDECNE